MAVWGSRCRLHRRLFGCCKYWLVGTRPGWISYQQRSVHQYVAPDFRLVWNKSDMVLKGSLSGLASQATARQGNILGILGVGSGILASLAAVGFSPEVLAQFAGVAAIGGTIGTVIGRRITAIELPQMVAALHSVVGLAAVLTSIASVLANLDHASTLHLVTAYLGVLIGEYLTISLGGVH